MNSAILILVVEDSLTQLEETRYVLEQHGYSTAAARNGKEALQQIALRKPDIVVSDIVMPEMDGYALCREIKSNEETRDVPVVLLTGLSEVQDIMKGMTCGADNFIVKPYREQFLLSQIQYILTNQELRKNRITDIGIEIFFAGKKHLITSDRFQIIDLLFSTFDNIVQKNGELQQANEALSRARIELEILNEALEKKVAERTRKLQEMIDELREAQEKLVYQERLHALGQMASGIAHDFNNALTPILGYVDILLCFPDKVHSDHKAKHYLENIQRAAMDAGEVVRRLREFYRPREKGEILMRISLRELIAQAVEFTQPRWKQESQVKGIDIRVETELPDLPPVAGNASELRQVFINLIFNAVDAMPNGGTITIHGRLDRDQVVLEIRDTGMGMSEDALKHCWEPFFTTKGRRGTGLGLSMVYGVVKRHGGTVALTSAAGKGTTVTIRILLSLPDSPDSRPQEIATAAISSMHVLLVEDDPQVSSVLREFLQCDGHIVETAANGLEGLTKFQADRFDVVITDMAMAEINGTAQASAIKRISPHTPIILVTGFGDLLKAGGAQIPDVDLTLSKPLTIKMLRDAMAQIFARVSVP